MKKQNLEKIQWIVNHVPIHELLYEHELCLYCDFSYAEIDVIIYFGHSNLNEFILELQCDGQTDTMGDYYDITKSYDGETGKGVIKKALLELLVSASEKKREENIVDFIYEYMKGK